MTPRIPARSKLPRLRATAFATCAATVALGAFVPAAFAGHTTRPGRTPGGCPGENLPPGFPCIPHVPAPSVVTVASVSPTSATFQADPGSGFQARVISVIGPHNVSPVYLYPSEFSVPFTLSGLSVSGLVPDSTYIATVVRFRYTDPKTGKTGDVQSPGTTVTFHTPAA